MSLDIEILGKQCRILDIYCFDADMLRHGGASVYFVTDQGVFIKNYPSTRTEGMWFEEENYKKLMADYYSYITSYEFNYDENGEPVNGNLSFIEFVNNPPSINPSSSNTQNLEKMVVAIVSVSIIALIVVGTVIFLLIRKRSKNKH